MNVKKIVNSMKKMILSMMLAAISLCGWAANNGDNTLKVKLDLVDFGDTVVVYRHGHEELTFIGKDGKFEFELEVDTPCAGLLLQPRLLRGDMEDPHFYTIPLVGGESVRVWDKDNTRFDVDGTGFYAEYHQMDLFDENASKELRDMSTKYNQMRADNNVSEEERSKYYNEVYTPCYDRYQQTLVEEINLSAMERSDTLMLNRMANIAQRMLKYYPKDIYQLNIMAIYHNALGQPEECLRYLLKAEKQDRRDCTVLANIANTYHTLENYKQERKYLEKLLKYGDEDSQEYARHFLKELESQGH